jgi:hypothetical protein
MEGSTRRCSYSDILHKAASRMCDHARISRHIPSPRELERHFVDFCHCLSRETEENGVDEQDRDWQLTIALMKLIHKKTRQASRRSQHTCLCIIHIPVTSGRGASGLATRIVSAVDTWSRLLGWLEMSIQRMDGEGRYLVCLRGWRGVDDLSVSPAEF